MRGDQRGTAKNVRFMTPFNTGRISVSRNPTFPDAYMVDLPLDSVPGNEWRSAFELKWKSSRDLWDRKLLLINDKVRLFTTAEGFVEKLKWVEKTIDETNNAIQEQYRLIAKEKGLIREKTIARANVSGAEIIMETLKKFNM